MNVTRLNNFTPCLKLVRFCHFSRYPCRKLPDNHELKLPQGTLGIFWDLNNYPKATSPYDAAIKLRKSVFPFGIVRYMVAYADRHAFSYVLPPFKNYKVRKKVSDLGVVRYMEKHVCKVCGRNFNAIEKLLAHFPRHEEQYKKRVRDIEAAKGRWRIRLVGKYSMMMERYRKASRDLIPIVSYNLVDELKRVGFWVEDVSDKQLSADVALRDRMVDLMDRKKVQCLVLVSDNSDFLGVLKEARERCVKTLVVGDHNNGMLKRNADGFFSWRDIVGGRARSESASIVERWRDRDVLKKLEWTYDFKVEKDADKLSDSSWFEYSYDPEVEKDANKPIDSHYFVDDYDENEEYEDSIEENGKSLLGKVDQPWWALD